MPRPSHTNHGAPNSPPLVAVPPLDSRARPQLSDADGVTQKLPPVLSGVCRFSRFHYFHRLLGKRVRVPVASNCVQRTARFSTA